ncbi:MAG: fluoride efflux transporter CrcB [Polymorphobacter sp.]
MIGLSAFPPLLLVAIGGGAGAMLRYLVGRWALLAFGPGFPVGTLIVNLLGGLAMGLAVGVLARISQGGEQLRLLLGVGVLGGFTTFSAFSLEMVNMVTRGDIGLAAGYAAASVLGSMAALFIGLWLIRGLGAA